MHEKWSRLEFEELLNKARTILEISDSNDKLLDLDVSEDELENILNFKDEKSTLITVTQEVKRRIVNTSVVPKLKMIYNHRCQICGTGSHNKYGVHISEGHHIEFFHKTQNNDADNIIILCPCHHRLMHKASPIFEREEKLFLYPNGLQEPLKLNYHL